MCDCGGEDGSTESTDSCDENRRDFLLFVKKH